ncbi:hypothetical protein [Tropicimonas sp. IMCC34043]|uniref:hypothetical protein n=1 Tax=Tropicimonas sp. IMCC34043 TaxID=2248760 RepID=UPI0013005AEF|nr:hypothetical protein [Tropicimonas sp. IMCC34043]
MPRFADLLVLGFRQIGIGPQGASTGGSDARIGTAIQWNGIHIAMITRDVAALATTGEALRKLALRIVESRGESGHSACPTSSTGSPGSAWQSGSTGNHSCSPTLRHSGAVADIG